MADIYDLVQKKLAQSQGRGRNQFYDPTADIALQIPQMIQKSNDQERVRNRDALDTIVSLYDNVDTPEGMRNIMSSLDSLAAKTGNDTEMQASIGMMKGMANSWNEDFNMYKNAVDTGAELVELDTFPQDIEDYQNLDKIANDSGFDTKLKYLFAEKEKINSLMDSINIGVSKDGKSRRFRYKGKDSSVLRKLNKHSQELDIAIQTLAGDGVITKDEAYHIMVGNTDFYDKKYKENVDASKVMIGNHLDNIDKLNNTMTSIKNKQLYQSDVDMWGLDLSNVEYELDVDGNPTNKLTDNSVETLLGDLSSERLLLKNKLNNSNARYRAWTGQDFGDFKTGDEEQYIDFDDGDDGDTGGDTGGDDGDLVEEELTEDEKIAKAKEEKKIAKGKEKTLDEIYKFGDDEIEIYEPHGDPGDRPGHKGFGGKDRQRIADSLGEKNYGQVMKNYVSEGSGGEFGGEWGGSYVHGENKFRATNLKIEDANNNLSQTLEDNNLSIEVVSDYVVKNMGKDFEKRFQDFLDKNSDGIKAREILYYLDPSLYKEKTGVARYLAAKFHPDTPSDAKGQIVGFNENHNKDKMKKSLENWGSKPVWNFSKSQWETRKYKNLDGYKSLMMLYNFIGQEEGAPNKNIKKDTATKPKDSKNPHNLTYDDYIKWKYNQLEERLKKAKENQSWQTANQLEGELAKMDKGEWAMGVWSPEQWESDKPYKRRGKVVGSSRRQWWIDEETKRRQNK